MPVSLKLGLYTRNCQLGLRSRSRGISARAYSALQVPPNPRALGSRSWLSGRFGLDSAVQAIGAFTPKGVKNRCVLQTYCTLKAIQDMSDPCSCANVGEARVTHSDLELRLDFSEKIIHGYVQHTVLVEEDNAHVIAVDTRDITLHKVQLLSSGSPEDMKYELSTVKEALGSTLSITLPSGLKKGDEIVVGIRYTTSKSCTAVQFLDPKQTAEGTHPYLFSQCQAIHARSLVPCQDLPSAKISYTATVWVPEELTALMSAVPVEAGEDERDAKRQRLEKTGGVKEKAFRFVQKVPIPTYLLAIAAGKLESRDIGPRSRIWSEASMVEAGAYEFAETEKFLAAGESIAGEYVWGRYDILLLPPSFPYGGMENPCLTFVTPTLLAGDRSQANVVAHEIAHSWCGNLVTNRTWEHFWMNEGFTVFLERNILAKMHGEPMLHFHALGGLKSLTDAVKEFGPDHPYTALVPDLSEGSDPDDAFSRVPYEKGFNFLYFLQTTVGGRDKFVPFFKFFIQKHAYKTVNSEIFKEDFLEFYKGTEGLDAIDWDTWLFKPGMPPVENQFDQELMTAASDLAKKWHFGDVLGVGGGNFESCTPDDMKDWPGAQMVAFLEQLLILRSMQPLAVGTVKLMEDMYKLNSSRNSEIRFAFFKLAIAAECEDVIPNTVAFLKEQGRMKYVRPLYRALLRSKMGKQVALDTFKENRDGYHPIAQKMLAQDLKL